jgi:flagellar biosynthesis GTPase FlhF
MKIRSYKGKTLNSIYDAIHRELGPGAVVIQPESSRRSVSGMLPGGEP